MLIGFVQGYEELKWGISQLNPLCNGPFRLIKTVQSLYMTWSSVFVKTDLSETIQSKALRLDS